MLDAPYEGIELNSKQGLSVYLLTANIGMALEGALVLRSIFESPIFVLLVIACIFSSPKPLMTPRGPRTGSSSISRGRGPVRPTPLDEHPFIEDKWPKGLGLRFSFCLFLKLYFVEGFIWAQGP